MENPNDNIMEKPHISDKISDIKFTLNKLRSEIRNETSRPVYHRSSFASMNISNDRKSRTIEEPASTDFLGKSSRVPIENGRRNDPDFLKGKSASLVSKFQERRVEETAAIHSEEGEEAGNSNVFITSGLSFSPSLPYGYQREGKAEEPFHARTASSGSGGVRKSRADSERKFYDLANLSDYWQNKVEYLADSPERSVHKSGNHEQGRAYSLGLSYPQERWDRPEKVPDDHYTNYVRSSKERPQRETMEKVKEKLHTATRYDYLRQSSPNSLLNYGEMGDVANLSNLSEIKKEEPQQRSSVGQFGPKYKDNAAESSPFDHKTAPSGQKFKTHGGDYEVLYEIEKNKVKNESGGKFFIKNILYYYFY